MNTISRCFTMEVPNERNKVVYGLIGYGGMGRWHTEILSNVPEAVIGGIYDIKEKEREAKEKGFSCI